VYVQAQSIKVVTGIPFQQCASLLRAQPLWLQIIDQGTFILQSFFKLLIFCEGGLVLRVDGFLFKQLR